MKDDNWFEYTFTVKNDATINGPIKVTQGLFVPLSNYTNTPNPTISFAEPKTNTNYVSVSGTRPGPASGIYIKGETVTDSSAKSGLTVNGKDSDVIVYAAPTIKLKPLLRHRQFLNCLKLKCQHRYIMMVFG
ncbi:MAG: hypothetical protein K5669_04805 [Lachnospiraceae bacterium]|nr:hypothetical protein [Lachnospiraceae bacterium]